MFSMEETYCVFPWAHLFVDPMGNFYTCCIGPSSGKPSSDKNGVLNASMKGAIKQHWHSLYMQNIRRSMQKNERHESCVACWRVENVGDKSYRHSANSGYKVEENVVNNIVPEPRFKFVDLRFGNICNLACRMCLPYSSRKLVDEYSQMFGEESTKPYLKLNWFESPEFWEELIKYSADIERIHLAGGEPLIIKQCWDFLKNLISKDQSKNLILSYNSNLTMLPPDLKEVWSKFKEVHLFISMDGVGEINEFIRYPLKWDSFEQNMKLLDNNFKDYNLHYVQIHSTVQVYNIHRITDVCDYVANFKNFRRIPRFDIVFGPDHFNSQVLPESYRFKAADKIDHYILELRNGRNELSENDREELIQNIASISNHLRGPGKPEFFHLFKRHNDIYDVHRKQKTFDYIPELSEVF